MPNSHQPPEQMPHLAAGLVALVLSIVVMAAGGFFARSLEIRSIRAIAASQAIIERNGKMGPVKNQGTALQQAALETDGLLPIYGSSELNVQAPYNRPFHATNLFRNLPTGFTVFPVGKAATTSLVILQKLAAVGPYLRGRKVVLSLSPFWFFEWLTARPDGYAGNFSALHAGELIFDNHLTFPLRQDVAARMLAYPETVANRPLLKFALENMVDDSVVSLACYEAVRPLGFLQNLILHNLDHWRVIHYLWQHPEATSTPPVPEPGQEVDWRALHDQASTIYREYSNNNEFGFDNDKWNRELRQQLERQRNTRSDGGFLHTLEVTQEWGDLALLLREMTELGAQPLVMSMPMHGPWYDRCGITSTARRAYYQKLREVCNRYHTPVVDFADHDDDRTFCHDDMGHLAPNGLVYYSQIFDDFFHDALPRQCNLHGMGRVPLLQGREEKP